MCQDDDDAVAARLMQSVESKVGEVNGYVLNMLALLKALDAREERMRETYYQYRLVNDKRWLKVMLRGAKDSDGVIRTLVFGGGVCRRV